MTSLLSQPLETWVFFLLVFARTVSIVSLAPVFGARSVPAVFRIGLSAVLAVLFSMVLPKPTADLTLMSNFLLLLPGEVCIGLVIGYVAMLFFNAVQMAGYLIDVPMGFSMVNIFDPHSDTQLPVMGDFYYIFAMLLFLAIDGHHQLILAMLESFRILGLGQSLHPDLLNGFVDTFALVFLTGVKISTPVVAVMLMSDAAMALLSRTVPSLNAFILGTPLKIAMGVLTMMLTFSAFLYYGREIFDSMFAEIEFMLRLLGGGA